MKLEITDPQYLWWDWVYVNHMIEAVDKYNSLVFHWASRDCNGCLLFGDYPRSNIKFHGKTLSAYRFSLAVATVIPLSSNDIVRHECNNPYCVNPRHLCVGDQQDNFRDYLAYEGYGTAWKLLRGWDSL